MSCSFEPSLKRFKNLGSSEDSDKPNNMCSLPTEFAAGVHKAQGLEVMNFE